MNYRILLFVSLLVMIIPISMATSKEMSPAKITVPILMYHHLGQNPQPQNKLRNNLTVSKDNFQQQLQYLADNKFNVISLEDFSKIINGSLATPTQPIILTFDDSYRDFYTVGYPELKKFNFKATLFVISGYLDAPDYITKNQLKEMSNSGLVEIASHTINHPELAKIKPDKAKYEIIHSKLALEKLINKTISFIAYPYGNSNKFVERLVQDAGYQAAIGTHYGYATKLSYNMPRIRISNTENLSQFSKAINIFKKH